MIKKRNSGLDGIASVAFDMERPLVAIESYGLMLCFFAETLDDNEGMAVQQVANAIRKEAEEIMKLRGYIIDALKHAGGEVCRVIENK